MERDDDWNCAGNSYDFGARIYDARLGRWYAADPLAKKQPDQSSYKAFLNSPLLFKDPDGKIEWVTTITENSKTGEITIIQEKKLRVMTDGAEHDDGESSMNYYYDFHTVIHKTDDGNGNVTTVSEMTYIDKNSHREEYDEYVWFGGDKPGTIKGERTAVGNILFSSDRVVESGGVVIYGSASNHKDAPDGGIVSKEPWGAIDFAAFNEMMSLLIMATKEKSELNIGPKEFKGKELATLLDKTKGLAKYAKDKEDEQKGELESEVFFCRACRKTYNDSNGTVEIDTSGRSPTVSRKTHAKPKTKKDGE